MIPNHQFLVIDEFCSWASSKHFPIVENDVSKGLVMWLIGCVEENSIIQGGLQQSGGSGK